MGFLDDYDYLTCRILKNTGFLNENDRMVEMRYFESYFFFNREVMRNFDFLTVIARIGGGEYHTTLMIAEQLYAEETNFKCSVQKITEMIQYVCLDYDLFSVSSFNGA